MLVYLVVRCVSVGHGSVTVLPASSAMFTNVCFVYSLSSRPVVMIASDDPDSGANEHEPHRADTSDDIEYRRNAYLQFVSTLPKTCSPNMFDMGNYRPSPASEESFNRDFQFNWSIDQIALLNPCDFSTEENASFFDAVDDVRRDEVNEQNDNYFNQPVILPSPDSTDPLDESNLNEHFSGMMYADPHVSVSVSRHSHSASKSTPAKSVATFAVSESASESAYESATMPKVSTPLNNMSRWRQKKKLFLENSEMAHNGDVSMISVDFDERDDEDCDMLASSFVTVDQEGLSFLSPIAKLAQN